MSSIVQYITIALALFIVEPRGPLMVADDSESRAWGYGGPCHAEHKHESVCSQACELSGSLAVREQDYKVL